MFGGIRKCVENPGKANQTEGVPLFAKVKD
jgi:hypothetical protein